MRSIAKVAAAIALLSLIAGLLTASPADAKVIALSVQPHAPLFDKDANGYGIAYVRVNVTCDRTQRVSIGVLLAQPMDHAVAEGSVFDKNCAKDKSVQHCVKIVVISKRGLQANGDFTTTAVKAKTPDMKEPEVLSTNTIVLAPGKGKPPPPGCP